MVRRFVERLDERSASTVDARLVEFLLSRPQLAGSTTISPGMTQHALAEELGTVREVVARTLRALGRQGLIERVGGGRSRIRDRQALAANVARD